MRSIPIALIYLRLLTGLVLLSLSLLDVPHYALIAISLITLGLVTDIFDGIIARRLNVSTEKLRRMDSSIDQVFWCLVAASAFIQYPNFFYSNFIELLILIGAEILTYIICYAKFRKEVATHAIASKVWTLLLFAALIQIMSTGNSGMLFQICYYVGLVTRLEILLILLLLRKWANDVPSFYHAVRLRQGKSITRNRFFNG